MTMDKDGFIAAVVRAWWENDCDGVNGDDFQEMVIKHGFAKEKPATEEYCRTEAAQEYGVEVGDPMLLYHDDFVALMKEREG